MTTSPGVFVVDDDLAVRRALDRLLRCEGYEVRTFGSGPAFLEGLGDLPDAVCVVLDVRLPGPSGFDVMEELTARGSTLPVILITGHADPLMTERAHRSGCLGFLTKPFDADTLLDTVKTAARLAEERNPRAG